MRGESLDAEFYEQLGIKEFHCCPGVQCRVVLTKAAVQRGVMKRGLNYFGGV